MTLLKQWLHALTAILIYGASVWVTIYLAIKLTYWLFR